MKAECKLEPLSVFEYNLWFSAQFLFLMLVLLFLRLMAICIVIIATILDLFCRGDFLAKGHQTSVNIFHNFSE